MDEHAVPDLAAATAAVDIAEAVIGTGVRRLAETGGPDANQVLAYDVAHAASAAATARSLFEYGSKGDVEARLACAFAAETVHDLITRIAGREHIWGTEIAPVSDEQLEIAIDYCSADRMRQRTKGGKKHVRSATVGDSRRQLNAAHFDAFRVAYADLIEELGYPVR